MKKGLKQVVAACLLAVLVIGGGFAGLPVQAAEQYEVRERLLRSDAEIDQAASLIVRCKLGDEKQQLLANYMNKKEVPKETVYLAYAVPHPDDNTKESVHYWYCEEDKDLGIVTKTNNVQLDETVFAGLLKQKYSEIYVLELVEKQDPKPPIQPQQPANPVESQKSTAQAHQHSYSWDTVREVGADQDGIEEYRCSCGDVKERAVIPASQYIVKGLCDAVQKAPVNGTAAWDSGKLCTVSDYMIRKLAARPDVTSVIGFTYQGKNYKMIIPAGTDFTALLNDKESFYGYFYFALQTGAVIEPV